MTTNRQASKKMESKFYSVSKLSKEFAENTSMHGLKFIAQDQALLAERWLWFSSSYNTWLFFLYFLLVVCNGLLRSQDTLGSAFYRWLSFCSVLFVELVGKLAAIAGPHHHSDCQLPSNTKKNKRQFSSYWHSLNWLLYFQITNYPFPTVTICSVNKVSTRALDFWMNNLE